MVNQLDNDYIAVDDNYSIVDWREKANPNNHWCAPYVTGKKYYVRWEHGLDFDLMNFEIETSIWNDDDKNIEFEMPFYDQREAVYVDDNEGQRIANSTTTLDLTSSTAKFGDNQIRNATETRRINMIINGKDEDIYRMTLTGIRCVDVANNIC